VNELLKERITRRLETLPEDKQYMVLDYVEFLESKYAERQAPGPNVFQRFAEGIEDTLRAGNVSASTVAEAMGFMGKAMNVLSGVAAAGKSVAEDLVSSSKPRPPGRSSAPAARPPETPATPPQDLPKG
jgi:Protein of unknown function (DUF2281)